MAQKMRLINCFLVLDTLANQVPTLTITDSKLYLPVLTLLTQDNLKQLKQLESGLKEQSARININLKEQLRRKTQNRYLDFLIYPSFQGVNRNFVLPFDNEND